MIFVGVCPRKLESGFARSTNGSVGIQIQQTAEQPCCERGRDDVWAKGLSLVKGLQVVQVVLKAVAFSIKPGAYVGHDRRRRPIAYQRRSRHDPAQHVKVDG